MSLKLELIISIALAVLATFVIASAMLYVHAIEKVETEIEAAIVVGARIATNAVDDVEEFTNPRRRLELLVADFDGDRHLRASVWDSLGSLLMTSRVAQPEEPPPNWFYDLLAGEPRAVTVDLPAAFDGHGTLVLETNAHNEVGEVWQDTVNLLSIVLIMCGIIVSAVSLIVGRALRPLGRLADALTRIGGHREPELLDERGPVEFVRVYQGFNQMVERLAHAEAVNRKLNEQLLSVQEEERADVARDLHDEIGPFLFAVDVDAASIKKMVEERRYQEIPRRVKSVREAVGHMQAHVKGILARLRPAFLLDLGLAHALENHISFLRGRHKKVELELDIMDEGYGKELDATIYRVVQEALSNAIRHGEPRRVLVKVRQEGDGVRVVIQDDGRGLPEQTTKRTGFGIVGMKERIAAHDGSLEVMNRADGRGVVVSAWLPLGEDELDAEPREAVLEGGGP